MADELAQTARLGDMHKLARLLRSGKFDPQTRRAEEAVVAAVEAGQLEALRALLDWGAPPASVERSSDTHAFLVAAGKGELNMVQLMCAKKADPNDTDLNGKTAMEEAITGHHFEIVKELMHHGVEAPEQSSVPGLGAAIFEAKLDIMTQQMRHFAKIQVDNNDILAMEDKVWIAMREHMRLLQLREEQGAGTMLVKIEWQARSEEAEAKIAESKLKQLNVDLRLQRVELEQQKSHAAQLREKVEVVRVEYEGLDAEDKKVIREIEARQAELAEAEQTLEATTEANQKQEGSNDELFAEIKDLEEEIAAARMKKEYLTDQLQAAEDELSGWLRDKEAAAELTAQAHKLLGH